MLQQNMNFPIKYFFKLINFISPNFSNDDSVCSFGLVPEIILMICFVVYSAFSDLTHKYCPIYDYNNTYMDIWKSNTK